MLVSIVLAVAAVRGSFSTSATESKPAPLPTKTVPDVIGQPYVFAESVLQEHGFGWKVEGEVDGWAEALVERQEPLGGTKVVNTGAPLVKLRLLEPAGKQSGIPENASPYPTTKIIYADGRPGSTQTQTTTTTKTTTQSKPKKRKPKSSPKKPPARPPAFTTPSAKAEPLDEIPLPERARRLQRWLDEHPAATNANQSHWLYQHAWIVTGARFGWWHGAEALEILIEVDEEIQELWGMGSASEAEARAALAFVREHEQG